MDDERESPEAASAAPASQVPPETPNPEQKVTHTESPGDSVRPGSGSRRPPVTRKEVLDFINRTDLVTHENLMREFGYTWYGAHTMLRRLKGEKLIERFLKPGEFCITEAGVKRLKDDEAKG
jgi:hypothetical protein